MRVVFRGLRKNNSDGGPKSLKQNCDGQFDNAGSFRIVNKICPQHQSCLASKQIKQFTHSLLAIGKIFVEKDLSLLERGLSAILQRFKSIDEK